MRPFIAHINVRRIIISLQALILCSLIGFAGTAQQPNEYQVKAAFLFNFSKFMEWPPASFSTPEEPFIVCILGNDPFGSYLDQIISGEKVMGHPMIIQRHSELKDIQHCNILFISLPGKTTEALATAKGKSVLTVSDAPDFCEQGGIVRFYTENDMIRLQINANAAKSENLSISSKLLRIAKICE